jgi:glyoxylase-like metal-dependent hydrolase (beta-lactamase superfamily II)
MRATKASAAAHWPGNWDRLLGLLLLGLLLLGLLLLGLLLLGLLLLVPRLALPACGGDGLWLQVLGSGGPELDDGRSSSGYVVWHDGKARVLVNLGGGSLARFEQADADLADLEAVLISHSHVDHSADLAALVKGPWFTQRRRELPHYGPSGNELMPGATDFVDRLLGPAGADSRVL